MELCFRRVPSSARLAASPQHRVVRSAELRFSRVPSSARHAALRCMHVLWVCVRARVFPSVVAWVGAWVRAHAWIRVWPPGSFPACSSCPGLWLTVLRISQAAAAGAAPVPSCRSCSAPLDPPTAKFCTKCGASQGAPSAAPPAPSAPPLTPSSAAAAAAGALGSAAAATAGALSATAGALNAAVGGPPPPTNPAASPAPPPYSAGGAAAPPPPAYGATSGSGAAPPPAYGASGGPPPPSYGGGSGPDGWK